MVEYSGYIPLQPMDWGKVAQEAAKPITDVIQERENQRKELNKINQDALAEVNKYSQSKAPTGAEFIMTASQNARSYIMSQYQLLTSGEITPEQFKRNTQNSKDSFKNLDIYIKDINKDIQEAQARVDSGEAGSFEEWLNGQRAKLLNLGSKLPTFSNDGFMYVVDRDGKVNDLQSLNMGINKRPQRVKVIDSVDKAVKGLGLGALNQNGKYVISQQLVGEWEKTKETIANSMLDNNAKIYSVLADNKTGYSLTDDESKVNETTILVKADENGQLTPQITDEQKKIAKEYIDKVISGRVSYKEEKQDPYKGWELSLKARELKAKEQELKEKGIERELPLVRRAATIERILSTGDPGPAIGALTQGLSGRSSAEDPENEAYAGYTFSGVAPSGSGYVAILTRKGEKGKPSDKKQVFYTKEAMISALNGALNSTGGSDEYKTISPEEIIPYFKTNIDGANKNNTKRGELD